MGRYLLKPAFIRAIRARSMLRACCEHRRLLCQILGEEVENGTLPKDMKLLEGMVRDISYRNAAGYFGMEVGKV